MIPGFPWDEDRFNEIAKESIKKVQETHQEVSPYKFVGHTVDLTSMAIAKLLVKRSLDLINNTELALHITIEIASTVTAAYAYGYLDGEKKGNNGL